MIASLSIIIILEVLSRLSTRPENGSGLAFAGADGLSTIANLGLHNTCSIFENPLGAD
jgi:hypothetical protein